MIGIIIIGIAIGYIVLANFIVKRVYEKTHSLKKKYIALAIMILIPTWDAILGLPIYMYLCKYHAGVKIYQTVDNVEGFYIGEQNKAKESITLPYKGYNFVDYKDKKDGKYYRNFWLDNNTSERCISYKGAWNPDYTKAFEQGRCIDKEEITESEVSQWEFYGYSIVNSTMPIFKIKQKKLLFIQDRLSKKILGEVDTVWWDVGYITGRFFTGWNSSMEPKGIEYMDGKFSYEDVLKNILKPKGDK